MAEINLQDVKRSKDVSEYLKKSDELLEAIGYTEHGRRHVELVAAISHNILSRLNFSSREQELAAIAGYLHDIGNLVNRDRHPQIGALIAFSLLSNLGMPADEIGVVMSAIGSHEEKDGIPVNPISAAIILADKADVHRTRVRNPKMVSFDIHDRVNYAVTHSFLNVDAEKAVITLDLKIDTEISPVMEYFEIFLSRMVICRRAAKMLNCTFQLVANGVRLL
ncbi:phosphohydrolase [Candidatus Desantisbacteria bacterium CG1_02_38_46]|uniref:Phosphohydrolase n=3 Tax=unclassified Candidatus Desantisiibacteriota TaxID=3106372 RepID=A0A2H9PD15_9BACT|nr:MAG: phosphohydrolase [Candidatus Desantisbacteria bacterium CG1_02_38_46]PIU52223.1 MAG: phosphohydrolase [Candidatus Desantisbacteria bacterium CG07_land_8_20_14_0_80_39_15]PIZ17322.1 MAG: phosphohydrolase [Candidatus Desantisbacteria bacterium CG_4_10_14_0_8_um_filter_39_17]